MKPCSISITLPLPPRPSLFLTRRLYQFPISTRKPCQTHFQFSQSSPVSATSNTPRGFGPSPKKDEKPKRISKKGYDSEEDEEEEDPERGTIPEVVTNRMINRMGFTVGVPLLVGLMFFPFFYYLKVVLKIDIPSWLPLIVTFFFFGAALLGISYGIVSSSWDPMREGSLLGWREAQKNWPVFWQSVWSGSKRN